MKGIQTVGGPRARERRHQSGRPQGLGEAKGPRTKRAPSLDRWTRVGDRDILAPPHPTRARDDTTMQLLRFLAPRCAGLAIGVLLAAPLAVPLAAQQRRSDASGPGQIRGRLVDGAGQPVTSGSITVRRASDTSFVGGALPDARGEFRVGGLPLGRYLLRIRALGHAPIARDNLVIAAEAPVVDVGSLTMAAVAATLAGQAVTAERAEVLLAPDRNSYSVKNMPGVAGGTAVDALRNTPAVEVDGSDQVSLRGNSNVVIQINGRATPLKGDQLAQFLKQLPTAALDRIEVATSPNAKTDPEGTAGIINIVLKGDVEIGVSAALSATTSSTGTLSTNGNVARQKGPLTLYLGGGLYQDQRTSTQSLDRLNLSVPIPATLTSRGNGTNRPRSVYVQLRGEYRVTEHDILSSEESIFSGTYRRTNAVDFRDYDATQAQIGQFLQLTEMVQGNHGLDGSVTYRHMPTPSLTTLSAEVSYSRNRNINNNLIGSRLVQADASTANVATSDQRDLVGSLLPSIIAQVDYTHPFGELVKLEGGAKHTWRHTVADGSSSLLDPATGTFADMPERRTASDYHERIAAVYGVLSEKVGVMLFQQGLRLERTDTRFQLPLTDGTSDFGAHYGSAFPSAIVTYNASPTRSARLSYTRRIGRPWPQMLSPVPFRSDQRTVFVGNPAVQPEYTDAYEITLQDAQTWGTIQLNPYIRRTAHDFRNIRRVDSLGVSTSTFANVASTVSEGVDLSVSFHRGPLNVTTGGGTYHYTSDAADLGPEYSVRTQVWNVRVNASAKLRPTTTLQLWTSYRGAQKTEGGGSLAMVFMNGGVRQQLWSGKGAINLAVSDPFGLTKFGNRIDDGRVVETSRGTFGSRQVSLSINRSFGQDVRLKERITQSDNGPPPGGSP
jgi:hypothetical protein